MFCQRFQRCAAFLFVASPLTFFGFPRCHFAIGENDLHRSRSFDVIPAGRMCVQGVFFAGSESVFNDAHIRVLQNDFVVFWRDFYDVLSAANPGK